MPGENAIKRLIKSKHVTIVINNNKREILVIYTIVWIA